MERGTTFSPRHHTISAIEQYVGKKKHRGRMRMSSPVYTHTVQVSVYGFETRANSGSSHYFEKALFNLACSIGDG